MQTREDLEKRVAALEQQLAAVTGGARRGAIRRRASWGIGDLPFYDIAIGPDLTKGELRGHARGVIAIGDFATGFLALGGIARGFVALGGLALGLVSFGGLSIGILLALGGCAIGGVAVGGAAAGGVAVGGGAAGYYSCGGQAFGVHTADPRHVDPEAARFFAHNGIPCGGRRTF